MKTPPMPAEPEWTIIRLLQWTADYFKNHTIDSPRMTAEILLAHCLGIRRIDLYLQHDKPLSRKELTAFKILIQRRVKREPVAYITGSKAFWSLDLVVTPDVLIPRPDTECLVEAALPLIPYDSHTPPLRILDLGTGSGAIILALADERPRHLYFATDRSLPALRVAGKNINNAHRQDLIHLVNGSWLSPFTRKEKLFDLIVTNPPYIRSQTIAALEPEVSRYEPLTALDGDSDGLRDIREIIETAPFYLQPGGHLLMEIGFDQKPAVKEMAARHNGYKTVDFIKDHAGHNRVVKLQKG